MSEKRFSERLRNRQLETQSVLCVGLDPDIRRLPTHLRDADNIEAALVEFTRNIIRATAPFACAFKLNLAFFEVHGIPGWRALEKTLSLIPDDVLTIADGKRGDIGNTARFYASSIFNSLGFDACTVAPYMGIDAVGPFLDYTDKCIFVLCRTSNPSADDFQLFEGSDGRPLFERVAETVAAWDLTHSAQAGLVVGATRPADLRRVRTIAPSLPFLIPGVGAQGGEPAETVQASMSPTGMIMVNSSRSILYASPGRDYAECAAVEANKLRQDLGFGD